MPVKNSLTAAKEGTLTLKSQVDAMMPAIKRALPKVITPERFSRIVITAITNSPALQKCSSTSFLGAMMNAAQLGLEPNTPLGQAYLIPYGNQCQFQIGYQGLIEVARRAGTTVEAHEIKANDDFSYTLGLHPDMIHKPALNNRGETVGYYAIWHNKDLSGFEVMTKDEIKAFAEKKSKAYKAGPWQTDFDAMAKKTVLKQALKYAPKSVELENAMAADSTVKDVEQKEASNETFDINLTPAKEEPEENAKPQSAQQATVIDNETGEVTGPDTKNEATAAQESIL